MTQNRKNLGRAEILSDLASKRLLCETRDVWQIPTVTRWRVELASSCFDELFETQYELVLGDVLAW